MDSAEMTAARVNGQDISLRALVQRARAMEQLQFIESAISAALIREAARQLEIVVTKAEVQEAANEFRERRQLTKAEDAVRWLGERGLTVADWQNMLEEDVLLAKFKSQRFGPKVASYFAEHNLAFDCATIGRIAVQSEGLACELLLQLREEGAVFEELARQFSLDEATKHHGGYVGRVARKDLGATASAAVFGAKPGSLLGPFKAGREFHLIRLMDLHPAVLDHTTRQAVEDRMFNEWLADARARAKVEIPLFEAPEPAGAR